MSEADASGAEMSYLLAKLPRRVVAAPTPLKLVTPSMSDGAIAPSFQAIVLLRKDKNVSRHAKHRRPESAERQRQSPAYAISDRHDERRSIAR